MYPFLLIDEDGKELKNKARMNASQHNQEEENDFNEIITLGARIETIQILLAYA